MTASRKTALCLMGGGVTGALYQVGALSALSNLVENPSFDTFVGTSSGAALAAALAGDLNVQRLYRALVDPADNYFPLERSHILNLDFGEWKRTITTGLASLRRGLATLGARSPVPLPSDLWEQLDRFYDALPAGLFSLDRYEQFLSEFFLRRRVPNSFRSLSKQLLITATDLDAGELVLFGSPELDHVPISLACAASMAMPIFFSPVRIGQRHYVDGTMGGPTEIEIARKQGAELIIVVNPNVPLRTEAFAGGVPSGHGSASSIRDKGLMWVYDQAVRTSVHGRLTQSLEQARQQQNCEIVLLEPDPSDAVRLMKNGASIAARRDVLEWAHRSTRETLRRWMAEHPQQLEAVGWKPLTAEGTQPPAVAQESL